MVLRHRRFKMKIMVFLHGTSIMHRNAGGRTREERVQQFFNGDESLYDFESYIPIDNAVMKLQQWWQQGAKIVYLSSHKRDEDVEKDKLVLQKYGFPDGPIYHRIGGEKEMTYPHIKPELKNQIKSIVVNEFGGIDHLPDEISALMTWEG
jgi:hypothetical protein